MKKNLQFYAFGRFACMYVCVPYVHSALQGHKRTFPGVSHHVDVGTERDPLGEQLVLLTAEPAENNSFMYNVLGVFDFGLVWLLFVYFGFGFLRQGFSAALEPVLKLPL